MLEVNRSLRVLDLSRNYKAMTTGSVLIFRSLTRNQTLQHLKLNSIVINECTLVSIRHCLERNRSLTILEMEDVEGMTSATARSIVEEARLKGSAIREIRTTEGL